MAEVYQHHPEIGNSKHRYIDEIRRTDIRAAIATAVELRGVHAALMQQGNNSSNHLPSSSPVSRHARNFSAQDYPIFTPSYEDEPLTRYQQILLENKNYAASWREPTTLDNMDDRTDYESSRKGFPSELMNLEGHTYPSGDQTSMAGSCAHSVYSKPRRHSLGDIKSVSSRNPTIIGKESDALPSNSAKSDIAVPLNNSHSSAQSQHRNNKGLSLSWIFPRLRKKNKNGDSPSLTQSDEVLSIGTLKKELMEAHEIRDASLIEVAETKSSIGELSQKLEYLEGYCEELKKALREAVKVKNSQPVEKLESLPKRGKSVDKDSMNLSKEVMVEGFLQMVSESRLSVKQFCKILLGQIEETDRTLVDNMNSLLKPHNISLNSRHSKAFLYHLEAIIYQSLYQDFENCVFQRNGAPNLLDPQQERKTRFQLFVSLTNLSWNEVLRKGTKYYSKEFSKFCDQKMSGIIAALRWTRPWPENLLQAFFVAAKYIWLLHLVAFSFDPPLGILRVDENRPFEPHYMEDVFADKQRPQCPSRVKVMVMPGFYVHDQVVRCKVLCRYKSVV